MAGDSGMSDSQFIRFQNAVQDKMMKFTAKTENEVRIKSLSSRFSKAKKPKGLIQKIKEWFGGK
jgi:hypothetical protein